MTAPKLINMIRIKDILEKIDYKELFGFREGDLSNTIVTPVSYNYQIINTITWAKNDGILQSIRSGVVICPDIGTEVDCRYIICENPRKSFGQVLKLFKKDEPNIINSSAKIGKHTILKNTTIEENVTIGANCTIGGAGFGYEEGELIPHIGRVRICEGVEIGNNVCIDRAVMGETIIGKSVKIDNLVHIAHGVEIGEGSMIIANAMIGGSVKIGKNVWIAPSVSILNGLTIGDNAYIGMGAVVLKDVEEGQKIVGNHRVL